MDRLPRQTCAAAILAVSAALWGACAILAYAAVQALT